MTTMTKTTTETPSVFIDGRPIPIEGERNLLEMVRKAGIDIPTFCYHSDLSIYGACRLCLVDVEGRGIMGACSTPPEAGLRVKTSTAEIRNIRRMSVELLLANHDQQCATCPKSDHCQLQSLARKLGIDTVRFKPVLKKKELDCSSPSLVRNPNRCVLCGDCIRMCTEVQSIGAIDFAHRGADVAVLPSFGKGLGEVECVHCGQCAAVCPTGALSPRPEVQAVWRALADKSKTVVAQIAPAVRVALGECFGMKPGEAMGGQAVAALKAMGFAQVYDTAFAADLTVVEEANEFVQRWQAAKHLPQFTSCCPAWVKFAEQYHPTLLENLSSCRSPQQMLGALLKKGASQYLGVPAKDVVVVAIMPCTAKKFEAQRPELTQQGVPDVDHVITTQELARMIEEAGLRFAELQPESFDMPLGFKTGAGIIFGNSGGVTEAVLRYAAGELGRASPGRIDFHEVRGEEGLREAEVDLEGKTLRLAVVHGLANARALAERVQNGEDRWDLIEVMACPGGCIGGAGQPVSPNPANARKRRRLALYAADKNLELHRSQENPFITATYRTMLGSPCSDRAHELLHTHFQNRRRLPEGSVDLVRAKDQKPIELRVCVGTSCYLKGSQTTLTRLLRTVADEGLEDVVKVSASFCFENCSGKGPSVAFDGTLLEDGTFDKVRAELDRRLAARGVEPCTTAADRSTETDLEPCTTAGDGSAGGKMAKQTQ